VFNITLLCIRNTMYNVEPLSSKVFSANDLHLRDTTLQFQTHFLNTTGSARFQITQPQSSTDDHHRNATFLQRYRASTIYSSLRHSRCIPTSMVNPLPKASCKRRGVWRDKQILGEQVSEFTHITSEMFQNWIVLRDSLHPFSVPEATTVTKNPSASQL
jgi:hypothetical protein